MAFRHKVKKAIEINEFEEEYEVIPRNYGYEVKLYGAGEADSTNIAWTLSRIAGYGNYTVVARKKYESIKCEL